MWSTDSLVATGHRSCYRCLLFCSRWSSAAFASSIGSTARRPPLSLHQAAVIAGSSAMSWCRRCLLTPRLDRDRFDPLPPSCYFLVLSFIHRSTSSMARFYFASSARLQRLDSSSVGSTRFQPARSINSSFFPTTNMFC
jgi:hypothetical protein